MKAESENWKWTLQWRLGVNYESEGWKRRLEVKTESERFAGALDTYTIEAMMQDGKVNALPMINQRIKFTDADQAFNELTNNKKILGNDFCCLCLLEFAKQSAKIQKLEWKTAMIFLIQTEL